MLYNIRMQSSMDKKHRRNIFLTDKIQNINGAPKNVVSVTLNYEFELQCFYFRFLFRLEFSNRMYRNCQVFLIMIFVITLTLCNSAEFCLYYEFQYFKIFHLLFSKTLDVNFDIGNVFVVNFNFFMR